MSTSTLLNYMVSVIPDDTESLDFLDPKPDQIKNGTAELHSASTSIHNTSDDLKEVRRLTTKLINLLNNHRFTYTDPLGASVDSHIAFDFEGRFHANPFAINWEQQTDLWRQMVSEHPDINFDVVDMNAQIRRRSGTASVLLSLAITGVGAVILNGLCELNWKFDGNRGEWLLHRHIVMRGPLLDGTM